MEEDNEIKRKSPTAQRKAPSRNHSSDHRTHHHHHAHHHHHTADDEHWVDVSLADQGEKVNLPEVGLMIEHAGGGTRPVTLGASGDLKKKELDYVFLKVTFLEDHVLNCKYQFFAGDRSPVELVLDPSHWLAPINKTYMVKVMKMGASGKDVKFRVRKDPSPHKLVLPEQEIKTD